MNENVFDQNKNLQDKVNSITLNDEAKLYNKINTHAKNSLGIGQLQGDNNKFINKVIDNTITIYNNILIGAVNAKLYQGDSPNSLYERIVLESLSKTSCSLNNMIGIVKNIKIRKKKNKAYLYVANIFLDTLYITNHIVIHVTPEVSAKVNKGDMILFNGVITMYTNNEFGNDYAKYSIGNFELVNRVASSYHEDLKMLEEIPENITVDYIPEFDDYFRILSLIINKIKHVTLIKTEYPENFYINILFSIHFAEYLEMFMLTHQNDYNYLKSNTKTLMTPTTLLLYLLDHINITDPYTVMTVLYNIYTKLPKDYINKVVKQNGITIDTIVDQLFKNYQMLPDFNNIRNLLLDHKEYQDDLYKEINLLIQNQH